MVLVASSWVQSIIFTDMLAPDAFCMRSVCRPFGPPASARSCLEPSKPIPWTAQPMSQAVCLVSVPIACVPLPLQHQECLNEDRCKVHMVAFQLRGCPVASAMRMFSTSLPTQAEKWRLRNPLPSGLRSQPCAALPLVEVCNHQPLYQRMRSIAHAAASCFSAGH
jgi:hypothetical protein